MSGIFAAVNKNGRQIHPAFLTDALSELTARGPDEQAYWQEGAAVLGHTLLRTTYESGTEQQPASLEGHVWISADACLCDRQHLIKLLQAAKCNIDAKTSDNLLILHAYKIWGEACLNYLSGEFAFTIWDGIKKQLFCATDHFGVVPVYYADMRDTIVCSNSLNVVRLQTGVSNDLNEQAIGDYLLFRMNHTPDSTFFTDISKLPAGHSLVWQDGQCEISRYWSSQVDPETRDYIRRKPAEYAEQFEALFIRAVKDRLRCDAAATHLSGGMDSTSIAAILAESRKQDGDAVFIKGYTMTMIEEALNVERPLAQITASTLNMPLEIINGRPEDVYIDDTSGVFSPEPTMTRSNTARSRIFADIGTYGRTLFTGFGGDAILSAETDYWRDQKRTGKWNEIAIDTMQHLAVHHRIPAGLMPFKNVLPHREKKARTTSNQFPDWFNRDFTDRCELQTRLNEVTDVAHYNRNYRNTMNTHPLWRRIFEWHDPGFTGVPVKVRFPFFDLRLFEWSQTVPPWPWFYRKYLLRRIMQDRLPQAIWTRAKTGVPGNKWKRLMSDKKYMNQVNELLDEPGLQRFLEANVIRKTLADADVLTLGFGKSLNRINSLAIWLRHYKNFDSQRPMLSEKKVQNYVRRK